MPLKELILIRHGELPEEYSGRFVGSTDAPLGQTGICDCKALAPIWKAKYAGSTVFVSPKARARESAELICGDCVFQIDDRLREIDFGKWENLTFAEIRERYPELCEEWMAHPDEIIFPDGESFPGFCRRVSEFAAMLRGIAEERVTVVSHGGVLTRLIFEFLGLPPGEIWRWQPGRGSLSVIEFGPDDPHGRFRIFNLTGDFIRNRDRI